MRVRRFLPGPSVLEIRPGAIEDTPAILRQGGLMRKSAIIVSGTGPTATHGRYLRELLLESGVHVAALMQARGTTTGAHKLAREVALAGSDTVVIGVGGGRVIDVSKLGAFMAGVPLVTIPTSLAHDGICSPVASLTDEHGRRRSHAAKMPAGVIVDVDVVSLAPPDNLRAGIGDLLSNLTAILDWRMASRAGHDRYNHVAAMVARRAAQPALNGRPINHIKFVTDIARSLVHSGVAMAIAGSSRPCSGAEHLISHSLDAMLGKRAEQHGLQVALGSLVVAAAHGQYLPELQERFVEVGLPTHPHDIGLSFQDFIEAIATAPATRPDRYTILNTIPLSRGYIEELLDVAFVKQQVQQAS